MAQETLEAKVARLEAENAKLQAQVTSAVRCKVTEKGGLSLYGIQPGFPITLYRPEWESMFAPGTVALVRRFLDEYDVGERPAKAGN